MGKYNQLQSQKYIISISLIYQCREYTYLYGDTPETMAVCPQQSARTCAAEGLLQPLVSSVTDDWRGTGAHLTPGQTGCWGDVNGSPVDACGCDIPIIGPHAWADGVMCSSIGAAGNGFTANLGSRCHSRTPGGRWRRFLGRKPPTERS